MSPRARPLSPEERRTSIVEAVLPLVVERGELPATREIAEAAGIAEGTIYRVFEDKPALLHAVVERALTAPPAPAGPLALEELPDLRARVVEMTRRILERHQVVSTVLIAVRRQMMNDSGHGGGPVPGERGGGPPPYVVQANEQLLERLTRVFEIDRDHLRVEPATAALVLRSLVFGSAHPGMSADSLTPEQIADVVLDGVCRKDVSC